MGNLRTGRIHATLPVMPGGRAVQTVNRPGDLTVQVPLFEQAAQNVRPWVSAAPVVSFLALDVGGRIVDAGPVWRHVWSERSGQLQVAASGLWSMLDHRLIVSDAADPAAETRWTLGLSEPTLAAIGREMIAHVAARAGASLPIVLPAALAGTGHERTIYGYELAALGAQLRLLTEVEGGPDIDFRPKYADGDRTRIEWVYTTGSPALVQSGPDWVWDMRVPAGPVLDLQVDVDGTSLSTKAWAVGAGTGEQMLLRTASSTWLTDAGYPLMDVVEQRKTTEKATTLTGHAQARLDAFDRPYMGLTVTLAAGDDQVRQAAVGDWAQVVVGQGHPYLPAGPYRSRISRISRTDEQTVQVTMTPRETT